MAHIITEEIITSSLYSSIEHFSYELSEVYASKPEILTSWYLGGNVYGHFRSCDTETILPDGTKVYKLIKDIIASIEAYKKSYAEDFAKVDYPLCPIIVHMGRFHPISVKLETKENDHALICIWTKYDKTIRKDMTKIRFYNNPVNPIVYDHGLMNLPYHANYPADLRERWLPDPMMRSLPEARH